MQVQQPRPTSHLARSSASQALAQQLPRLPTPRISDKSRDVCHKNPDFRILSKWLDTTPMSLEIKYRSAIFATRATRSSHTGVTQHTSNGCPLLLYQNQQIVQVITKSNLKSLEIKIDSTAKYSLFSNICHLHLQDHNPKTKTHSCLFFCRLAGSHVRFIQLLNSCALGDR